MNYQFWEGNNLQTPKSYTCITIPYMYSNVKESTPPNRHFLYIDADMWLSWSCFVENQ